MIYSPIWIIFFPATFILSDFIHIYFHIYICMNKENLALNNIQWLTRHTRQPNHLKVHKLRSCSTDFYFNTGEVYAVKITLSLAFQFQPKKKKEEK